MAAGSVITIAETSGTQARRVSLIGSALPDWGASWKTSQKVVTDWYPGNGTTATQQVLGPREMPSTWGGQWRRNMMVRAPSLMGSAESSDQPVATPATLRDFLDLMFFQGARLQVTWTVDKEEVDPVSGDVAAYQFQLVRTGRATEWDFPHDDIDDIHWSIKFDWDGRGGQQQIAASTRDADVSTLGSAVIGGINDTMTLTSPTAAFFSTGIGLSGSLGGSFGFGIVGGGSGNPAGIGFGATAATLGRLETVSPALLTSVATLNANLLQIQNRYQQASVLANKLQTTPIMQTQNVVAMCTTTIVAANNFRQALSAVPFELDVQVGSSLADMLRAAKYVADLMLSAAALANVAQDTRTKALPRISSNPGGGRVSGQQTAAMTAAGLIAVYTARAGDTPQWIARKFYGSAEQALFLMRANHLPWGIPSFVGGDVLIIPALTSQQSATTV
jgi:DNA-binding CsgD family transcriptional regulator